MIISVDHGNKSIKTPNTLFTSGLISSEGLQGFKTDYICWNGRYYTLTEQRISYLRDKTEDERFYVLTLFAIAKELERRKAAETLDPIDITLLIGLPPAHYEQLHSRFEQYFLRRREAIDFEYNGKYYSIRISKVLSYPQAFAAAVTQYSTLKTYSVAYIIDIGGFTIDVLKLRKLIVDEEEAGVVIRIFAFYLGGKTPYEIAKILTSEGIPSPTGKSHWTVSSVTYILGNDRYCGDIIMQKSICVDLFAHKRVRNLGQAERFRVRGVHTPLVSKEDWREVKNRVSMPDREAVILEDITGEGVLAELHPIQFKEDIDI